MRTGWLALLATGLLLGRAVQLTSDNDLFTSRVAGFTTRLQCSVHRCGPRRPELSWYKDDSLLFNDTRFAPESGFAPEDVLLQQTTRVEPSTKGPCSVDEHTLLLRNPAVQDSGVYRCKLNDLPQQLDFKVDVLDSGLKPGFAANLSFDLAECCVEKGLSPLCRPMCKPRDLDLDFFDPTSCSTADYRHFLGCATHEGRLDFSPCCARAKVPAFCLDFCSARFLMLKRSHRLCLYYLPEIMRCFSQRGP